MKMRSAVLAVAVGMTWTVAASATDPKGPAPVKVVHHGEKWQLLRADKPYFIRGGGGGGPKAMLARCGGNSFRTWGIGADTQKELDEAQRCGLTVAVGHWLGHKDHGFRYNDPRPPSRNSPRMSAAPCCKYKKHPALLLWGLGNEMENNDDTPELWRAVQDLAKMVHQIDPNHPTMTVMAEIGGNKVRNIHKYCPDIDVIGINSYGGGASLAERYRKAGGTKPFVVTEFGPPGTWEIGRNAFGAATELTSTQKARLLPGNLREVGPRRRRTCAWVPTPSPGAGRSKPRPPGSACSCRTQPAGRRRHDAGTLDRREAGSPLPRHGERLALTSKDQVAGGGNGLAAVVRPAIPRGDALSIEWTLCREQASYDVRASARTATPSFPDAIARTGRPGVSRQDAQVRGGISPVLLFVTRQAARRWAACRSRSPARPLVQAGRGPSCRWCSSASRPERLYIPSGWMGDIKAIRMDPQCTENPHSGKTCLRVSFGRPTAGAAWSGSTRPTIGATSPAATTSAARSGSPSGPAARRAAKRSSSASASSGSTRSTTTARKGEIEVTLTKDWKQYTIDLGKYDLGCIKSGFRWAVGGQGKPVTFYLNDIRYK